MSFKDFIDSSITTYAWVSTDKYSKDTYSTTGVVHDARIKTNTKIITNSEGNDITPDVKISIDGDAAIEANYKIMIGLNEYSIDRIYKPKGVKQVHHTIIYATKVG